MSRRRRERRIAGGTRAFSARTTGLRGPPIRTLGCGESSHPFRVRKAWNAQPVVTLAALAKPPAKLLARLRRAGHGRTVCHAGGVKGEEPVVRARFSAPPVCETRQFAPSGAGSPRTLSGCGRLGNPQPVVTLAALAKPP